MTEAVYDFPAINRRLNRKPEPVALEPTPDAPKAPRYVGYAGWAYNGNVNHHQQAATGAVGNYSAYNQAALAENARLIRENRAARALMDADAIERKTATFAEVKASHEKGCSIATLRAEVEQMEREQEAYTRNKANG